MSVKWSPMEIQEMHFSSVKRGYDPEEVRSFLMSMAEQVEILLKDREEMRKKLEYTREELAGHKQREQILKDTLLTAQKVASDLKSQAEREGEVVIKEAELKAENLFRESSKKVVEVERQLRDLKLMRHRLVLDLEQTMQRFQKFFDEEKERLGRGESEVSTFVSSNE